MKNIKCIPYFITAILLVLVLFIYNGHKTIAAGYNPVAGQKPDLVFSVLGDVHTDIGNLETAVLDLYRMYPRLDGLVLNGDIVDQGLDEQYEAVSNFFVSNAPIIPANIIYNIGNHEFYDYKKGVNSTYDNQVFIKRFLEFSNQKSVYHDTWINGYHFISLGSENTHTLEQGPVDAYISKDQMEWLKEKLQDGYTPGKPIFVFLHQPIGGTPIGGKYNSGSVIQDSELSSILSQYPESILFSSHTHAVLNFDKVIDDNQFKKVHTGAVHNPLNTGGSVKGSSQGIIVEVLNDKVKIKGRDFEKGEWIGETDILIQPLWASIQYQ